jgi:hypothetical protein
MICHWLSPSRAISSARAKTISNPNHFMSSALCSQSCGSEQLGPAPCAIRVRCWPPLSAARGSCGSQFAFRGAFPCTEYRGERLQSRCKASVQTDGIPTKWSETYFLTSPERFGRRTQRRTWHLSSGAKCDRPSVTCQVSANGPAMRSRSSSQKSCAATVRATSKSNRNNVSGADRAIKLNIGGPSPLIQ